MGKELLWGEHYGFPSHQLAESLPPEAGEPSLQYKGGKETGRKQAGTVLFRARNTVLRVQLLVIP